MLKKVIEIDSVIENISALNRNYLASLWTGSEIYKSNGIVCTCKNHSHVFFYVHIKMSRAYPYERIFRQNTYVNALAWTCLKLYIQSTSSTVYTLCICTAFSLALNIFYSKFKTFLDFSRISPLKADNAHVRMHFVKLNGNGNWSEILRI